MTSQDEILIQTIILGSATIFSLFLVIYLTRYLPEKVFAIPWFFTLWLVVGVGCLIGGVSYLCKFLGVW